jgi:hypothetical protein
MGPRGREDFLQLRNDGWGVVCHDPMIHHLMALAHRPAGDPLTAFIVL